jgi:hypothetical protein
VGSGEEFGVSVAEGHFMAGQLERSSSSVRESTAIMQRSVSALKESATPILQRTSSMLKGSPPSEKLRSLPSMTNSSSQQSKQLLGSSSPAIRNRNIVIGVLSALLVLAVVPWPWQAYMGPSFTPAGESGLGSGRWMNAARARPYHHMVKTNFFGSSRFLVTPAEIKVPYHKGPLLVGAKGGILKVYLIYYGTFTAAQKNIFDCFFSSFADPKSAKGYPTVAGWWAMTKAYKDTKNISVAQRVVLGGVYADAAYSLKKNLKQTDIESLVTASLKGGLPLDPTGLYIVLTAADVVVQGFCANECGTHMFTSPSHETQNRALPFAWVGNAAKQCAGYCAWPFAKPAPGTGPDVPPLKAPNEVGADGMIINIASMLLGAATDPYGNGYYQGVAADPLEAAGVCGGIFGNNAYPGYAGDLLKTNAGASYNVNGDKGCKFLLPWYFNPATKQCAGQA